MVNSTHGDPAAAVADDLLLLLLDDFSGQSIVERVKRDLVVSGAVLLELIGSGRVSVTGTDEGSERAELVPVDRSPTGDEVLDGALSRLPDEPLELHKAVRRDAAIDRDAVLARMIGKGSLSREVMSLFGLIRVKSWPAAYRKHERSRAESLRAVLVDGAEQDERTALLVSLVWASGATHAVVGGERKRVEERAARIAEGDWAGPALREAIRSVRAGMAAAASVAASAAAVG